jgi:glyoxylase I family protein
MTRDADSEVFSHICMVVTDLEQTGRFYAEAFGFALEWEDLGGAPAAFLPIMELQPPVRNRLRMYRKGPVRLEFSQYLEPDMVGSTERVAMNRMGITHIAFRVVDLEATLANIRRLGGTVLDNSRVRLEQTGDYIMCLDPNGVRIELMPQKALPRG